MFPAKLILLNSPSSIWEEKYLYCLDMALGTRGPSTAAHDTGGTVSFHAEKKN